MAFGTVGCVEIGALIDQLRVLRCDVWAGRAVGAGHEQRDTGDDSPRAEEETTRQPAVGIQDHHERLRWVCVDTIIAVNHSPPSGDGTTPMSSMSHGSMAGDVLGICGAQATDPS
jgi:hypothetical protein